MFSSVDFLRLLACTVIFLPLFAAVVLTIAGRNCPKALTHWVTTGSVFVSFCLSVYLFLLVSFEGVSIFTVDLYTWAQSGAFSFKIAFLIDRLTLVMMCIVNFISVVVHFYSIGYMKDDPGYRRFFSYISMFTFFMLLLVSASNLLVLFFGWEGVGLISYFLIGFWFQKESANQAGLKAFIVNRVGDFAFILGIAMIFAYFGTLDYQTIFADSESVSTQLIHFLPSEPSVLGLSCFLLFVGAMGKSAQIPLHIWLPESMEGPTPISALIHAATMVTAGVYMVVRLSPIFEYAESVLNLILVIGSLGALFLGIVALVQNDIKRVIAYSTLSQLGYMMAAAGASAFSASIFHLLTHACFKALLFLAAGSVIFALHHEQDMRKMGGLRTEMPMTYLAFLVGALALSAVPPFSGFYSKDGIIAAVHASGLPFAPYAYYCLLLGAFVTALYIFRCLFLTFHGRYAAAGPLHLMYAPSYIILPLIFLSLPSMLLGVVLVAPMLYGAHGGFLGSSVLVLHTHALGIVSYPGVISLVLDAFLQPTFWLVMLGIFTAWLFYIRYPSWPSVLQRRLSFLYWVLVNKYGFDAFNQFFFVKGTQKVSHFLFSFADVKFLDGTLVDGTGRVIQKASQWVRSLQSGYLYHYAFVMVFGLFVFLTWLLV